MVMRSGVVSHRGSDACIVRRVFVATLYRTASYVMYDAMMTFWVDRGVRSVLSVELKYIHRVPSR